MFIFANSIVKFNEFNYGEWSKKIWFTFGVITLDFAIVIDVEPLDITKDNSHEKPRCKRREQPNKLSLNLMRLLMTESIKSSMSMTEKGRKFIE